ncbi:MULTISPECIES: M48 family metalloprotease [unclassified Kitasatospora]|uniref:M48 family metalloprotease n=1 Tax=unclassified Kitasatospora TaxID=2633591 RepID=UPI00340F4822
MGAPQRSTGMSTSVRAVTAVALLAGFYLLALGIVAGLLTLDIALFQASGHLNPGLIKIWGVTAVIGYPVLRVVFLTRRRTDDGELPGVRLTREQQPAVWGMVDRIAERTGVRGPAEIRLVPEVNAGVLEETKLLGLVPGKRHLVIGAPLLMGLTEGELESVLAHEFGHYSNRDVRLAAVTVAGRRAVLHTIGGLHQRADLHQAEEAAKLAAKSEKRLAKGRKPAGEEAGGGVDRALAKLFTLYAKLYFRVSEAVGRRQEYAADLVAARLAGRDATASALRKMPVLDSAQDFYLGRYATIGWDAGLLPPPGQVYGGLLHLLSDPKRRQELAEYALELPEHEPDPYDSHPPIDRRVAAIEALPDDGRGPGADAPALALLHDAERVLAELEVVSLIPEAAGKQRVEWPALVRGAMLTHAREAAAPAGRALTALGLPPTVHGLLDAVDAGRAWEFTDRLPKSEQAAAATGRAAREFARPALREELAHAAVVALAEAGRADWELSWSGPAELRLPDGFEDAFDPALDAACTDTPDTAPLRALLAGAGLPSPTAPAV